MLYRMVDVKIVGQLEKEKALEISELNQFVHCMSAIEIANTLMAFQRYLEFTPDDSIVATLATSNGLEVLCQGHMGERYICYVRLVDDELIICNDRHEDIFDYAEEMEFTQNDIEYIRFGKKM